LRRSAFENKVVVLRLNRSLTRLRIDVDGRVLHDEGRDILDPSSPCWGGEPPVLAMPE